MLVSIEQFIERYTINMELARLRCQPGMPFVPADFRHDYLPSLGDAAEVFKSDVRRTFYERGPRDHVPFVAIRATRLLHCYRIPVTYCTCIYKPPYDPIPLFTLIIAKPPI